MQRERQSPPDANQGARSVTDGDDSSVSCRADNFLHDALLELFLSAEAAWWDERAEDLLAARPRPEDFHGAATREQLSAQWQRLTAAAQACRARAQVSPVDDVRADVANVLREAS